MYTLKFKIIMLDGTLKGFEIESSVSVESESVARKLFHELFASKTLYMSQYVIHDCVVSYEEGK